MRRLRRESLHAPAAATPARRWWLATTGIAAAVLLTLTLLVLRQDKPQPPHHPAAMASLEAPGAPRVVERLTHPLQEVTTNLTNKSLRSVPQDTRALAGYFLRQFPTDSLRRRPIEN